MAISPSAVAAHRNPPSLFSSSAGSPASADVRILGALGGDSDARREPRRVRRVLTGVALGAACVGLLSVAWGYFADDLAFNPSPSAVLNNEAGTAADKVQAFGEPPSVAPVRVSAATIVDSAPSPGGKAYLDPQAVVQSAEMPRPSAGRGRAAVIAAAAVPILPRSATLAARTSKPQGQKGRPKAAAERRTAAPRAPVKASALRAVSRPASRTMRAAQIDEPMDPDVQIIEAIVTRSK